MFAAGSKSVGCALFGQAGGGTEIFNHAAHWQSRSKSNRFVP